MLALSWTVKTIVSHVLVYWMVLVWIESFAPG